VIHSLRRSTIAALVSALAATSVSLAQAPQQPLRPAGPPQGTAGPAQGGGVPNGAAPAGAAPAHHAQGHPGAAASVAIIDLPYILKNHGGFNQRLEELRREAEGVENDFKAKRDAIQKIMVQLEELQRGSPDYKKLEEEITKRQAGLSVDINIAKKKFQEAEARIYYEVYQQILAEVRYYAEANRIGLVLKFNGDEANKDNPDEIMREMQKMVLYYNHSMDITPIMLERMKAPPVRAGGNNPAAQRPGVQPRRQ
jgi:Skp family chaperone for outer membrane proteins